MARKKETEAPLTVIDEAAIEHLCRVAGITIPLDRVPGAVERLNDMLAFLHQLDDLEIGDAAPASVFDPSWQETRH